MIAPILEAEAVQTPVAGLEELHHGVEIVGAADAIGDVIAAARVGPAGVALLVAGGQFHDLGASFRPATRAAADEGIVPGGGIALLKASNILADVKGDNADQNAGIALIRRALEAPMRQIAENAGVDGAVVAGKVRESSDKAFGFNAQTEEYGDMFKFGVIDPAKVVRTALEDAASVAGLLITTEAMIAEKPEPKAAAGGMGGGMGGMGGMDMM